MSLAVYVAIQARCSARRHEATATEKFQPWSKGNEKQKATLFTERDRAVKACKRSGCWSGYSVASERCPVVSQHRGHTVSSHG